MIRDLNPVLRGWGNHFRTGNASRKFQQVGCCVRQRLVALLAQRGGRRRAVSEHGLYRLMGTIRYPEACQCS